MILYIWLALAIAVTAALIYCRHKAVRARFELKYLAPHQHRALMALAEVLVLGREEALTPVAVAANVDDYLYSFPAEAKSKAKLALTALWVYPMLRLRPPYPIMSPQERIEFIERCFISDVAERRLPGPIRRLIQSILVAAQSLTFIGYYADPRAAESTGYVPFSEREEGGPLSELAVRPFPPLNVRTPREVDSDRITADVVIVGSGAAGAVLAKRMAEKGREVIVLERGLHVDPSEFTEDESKQFALLYADGGMQMSTDARFQVLQGKCVGGTTVVNNAVCFDLPDHVLERWNDGNGLDAGLDEADLAAAFGRVREFMPVKRMTSRSHLAGGAVKFRDGIEALGLDRTGDFDIVEANMSDCLGSGYCNIGCPLGPQAVGARLHAADGAVRAPGRAEDPERVRRRAHYAAERIGGRGRLQAERRAEAAREREHGRRLGGRTGVEPDPPALEPGRPERRPRPVVQPRRADDRGVPGEDRLVPRPSDLPLPPDAGRRRPDPRDVVQPGRRPGALHAWLVPRPLPEHAPLRPHGVHGLCGRHRPDGRVSLDWRGRMKLTYDPHPDDLKRLVAGLKLAGQDPPCGRGRAGNDRRRSGSCPSRPPSRWTSSTRKFRTTRTSISTPRIPRAGTRSAVTARAASSTPTSACRMLPGVYVCDASVFPAAITVNPQLTVMALAEYAAERIE